MWGQSGCRREAEFASLRWRPGESEMWRGARPRSWRWALWRIGRRISMQRGRWSILWGRTWGEIYGPVGESWIIITGFGFSEIKCLRRERKMEYRSRRRIKEKLKKWSVARRRKYCRCEEWSTERNTLMRQNKAEKAELSVQKKELCESQRKSFSSNCRIKWDSKRNSNRAKARDNAKKSLDLTALS